MHYVILFFLATLTALLPLFFNSFFYFRDDFQSYYMPFFEEAGRILSTGEFPLLTSRSWFGGSILAEYQWAIFNPISLMLYLIFYKAQLPLEQAGAIFTIFHLVILSLGCFFLCRRLNISLGGSYFVSLSILHSGFLIYWTASSWVGILMSYSWLPWAIGGFYSINNKKYTLIGILASYLLIVSGTPHVCLMWLLFTLGVIYYFYLEKEYKHSMYVIIYFVIACFLSAPAIFPVAEYLLHADRGFRDPYMWKASLEHLLSLGMPTFRGIYKIWDGSYNHSSAPFSYVSWVAPIIILGYLMNPQKKTTNLIKSMGVIVILFGIACMFPSPILMQNPFRFLLGFHLSILLLAILILSRENKWKRLFTWRVIHLYSGCLFLLPILSFIGYLVNNLTNKLFILFHLGVNISLISLLYTLKMIYFPEKSTTQTRLEKCLPQYLIDFLRSLKGHNGLLWIGCCVCSVTIFMGILFMSKENNNIPDFQIRTKNMRVNPFKFNQNDRVLYFLQPDHYWMNLHNINFHEKTSVGNTTFYRKHKTLNGYSPMAFTQLKKKCDFTWLSFTNNSTMCIKNMFAIIKPYNKPLIELMGVNQIVSFSNLKSLIDQHKTPNWKLMQESDQVILYTHVKQEQKPSVFGYLPTGVSIHSLEEKESSIQFIYTTNQKYDGLPILISRLGIPGYFYQENDQKSKTPPLVSAIIPSIPLQKNANKSHIKIYYFPKGLTYGLYAFGFGLILLIIFYSKVYHKTTCPSENQKFME